MGFATRAQAKGIGIISWGEIHTIEADGNSIHLEWSRTQYSEGMTLYLGNEKFQVLWKEESAADWQAAEELYFPYSSTMPQFTITNLKKGKYVVEVRAILLAGKKHKIVSYGEMRVMCPGDSENPKPSSFVSGYPKATSPTTIEMKWNPATDNATPKEKLRYRVRWWKASWDPEKNFYPPGNNTSYTSYPQNLTSHKIEGLEPGTEYGVDVEVYDEAGNLDVYSYESVTTPPAPDTEKPKPSSFVSGYPKATSPTTIEMKWNPATDNATPKEKLRYRVRWWKASWDPEKNFYPPGNNTSYTSYPQNLTSHKIEGLEPGTEYGVDVEVYDEAGNLDVYSCESVTTPTATGGKDTEAPEKGTYVGDPVVTASTITLKWTPGKDNKTPTDKLRYRFIWMKVTDKEWNSSVPDGAPLTILPQNITEYSFESLASGTAYWVNVGAYDEAGNYVWYGAKKVTTLTENTIAIKLTPEKMEVGANQQSKEVGVSCDKAFRITGIGTMSDWISNFSPTSEEVKTQHSVTFNVKANPGAERTGKLVINTTRGSLTLIVTQAAKSAEEGNKAPEPQGYVGTPVVTSSTIKLKWNPATDDKTAQKDLRYMVAWTPASEEDWQTSSSEADMPKNMTEYEIKGLKENTQYIVNVAVVDEAGKETRYGELKITTLPKGTKPDEPNPNPGVVSKPVTSLTLDQTAVTVNGNLESFLLKAVVLPADADNPGLKWSSSNPSVASVVAVGGEAPEPSGKLLRSGPVTGRTVAVHIHSKGKAVITAQTIDGSNKSATCQVDVLATVGNMEASATRIYTSAGRLYLSLPTPTPVEIYTLLGVRLRTFIAPAGDSSVTLPQGMYVVRAGRKIEKVVAN